MARLTQCGRTPVILYAVQLKLPIEVGGELPGSHISIDVYPDHRPHEFMIGILFDEGCVCRLDNDPWATHSNKWDPDLPPFVKWPPRAFMETEP